MKRIKKAKQLRDKHIYYIDDGKRQFEAFYFDDYYGNGRPALMMGGFDGKTKKKLLKNLKKQGLKVYATKKHFK